VSALATDPCVLYLARHGETDWNRQQRWQGQTDIPLNSTGRAQAQRLAHKVAHLGLTHVYASDLSRARQTGQIIAEHLGLPPVEAFSDLRERNFGVFEGLTRVECETQYPDHWKAYRSDRRVMPPGSEPHQDVIDRMLRRITALANAPESSGDSGAQASSSSTPLQALSQVPLIISHGGAIRVALGHATGAVIPPLANTALLRVEHAAGRILGFEQLA